MNQKLGPETPFPEDEPGADETGADESGADESGADALVRAAKEAGAVEILTAEKVAASELSDESSIDDEVKKEFERAPSTKDVIGTGKLSFHPELPQVDFRNLVGHTFLLYQPQMVDGWDGFYGTSNFGLIMVQLRDGRKATSLAGGIAVVKQLRSLLGKRRFPVRVTLTEKPGQNGSYYLFE